MLPNKTEKLLPINEEISKEMQKLIATSLKSELLCGNSKTVIESIDKIYLYDKKTEAFYSKLASNLLISLFIVDFTRKLNNNLNKKYNLESLNINTILEDVDFKKYYINQIKDLEKDPLLSWFVNLGLALLDDCLNKKQFTTLKDVVNIDIEMDLLREYLERVEDNFDFYEILTQFRKAFEKYPSRISKVSVKTTTTTTIEIDGAQEIHNLRGFKYENIEFVNVNNTGWHL